MSEQTARIERAEEMVRLLKKGAKVFGECPAGHREAEAAEIMQGLIQCFSESVDSRWVPASEFRPQDGEVVLCYWPTNPPCMQSLTYLASDSEVDGRDAWRDLFDNDEDEPSHWMPLPKVPK